MGMRSRFIRPAEIQAMMSSNNISTKVEHPNRYTAWIIADKN
jgi:hypothetical protein